MMLEYLKADPELNDQGREGTLLLPYDRLVELIGPPTRGDDEGKVSASWGVRDEQGAGFALWNYRWPGSPRSCSGWSVGFPDASPANRELIRRVFAGCPGALDIR